MKIVYTGLKYTNYDPGLGLSFEHNSVLGALNKTKGLEIIDFPYERILELGRERGNAELLDLINKEKPDLFLAFMFTDELLISVLEKIKEQTVSLAWFSDDHWRFDNYSKHYAPHFSWIITTYSKAVDRYIKNGVKNFIHSQWAADCDIFKSNYDKQNSGPDVSFVGAWSRPRQKIISALKNKGINVECYGSGWLNGRISSDKMVEIFSSSKINLALNPAPGFLNKNSLGRLLFRRSMDKIVPDFNFWSNFKSWIHRGIPQIKARHFEISACGGFLMTSMADNLGDYYKIGEEIVIYKDIKDLIDKINYYLKNDKERKKIAEAGYLRTTNEHTYEKRFEEIFKIIFK
ncbi:MAG: glycosyltransferase [Candidatus Wolfebacteria bacterium]|nr:glycosyltransferase [Candidatus Wolfebacteria bacterium]